MNILNNLWNYDFIKQQAQQNCHQSQVLQVSESAGKLQDFFDSLKDIEPEYRSEANRVFSTIIINHIRTHADLFSED